jgi:hypothetical protein
MLRDLGHLHPVGFGEDSDPILVATTHPGIEPMPQLADEDAREAAQLLQALNKLVSDEQRHAKTWPENARSLGHCLRRLAAPLRRVGIKVEHDKGTRRIIYFCKAREKTSETSASPGNCAKKDVQDVSDDLSACLHVSNQVLVI